MDDIFKRLNENQIEAVRQTFGPVIVVAGAGSGKTRVLTHRIAYLVSQGISSSNILAVTFTNKAALEMRDRVCKIIDGGNDAWIMTFHSMCARILREYAKFLGYTNKYEIYDEEDSTKALKQVLKNMDSDANAKEVKRLISAKKNGKVLSFDDRQQNELDYIFNKYNELLKNENAMDFDDLLNNTLKLFQDNKEILEHFQNKFLYIMVDEFQDTNTVQYDLIKILAFKNKNIFVVGDGDQSIYSFRNANVGNINAFIKDFIPKKIVLDINYRSSDNILKLANSLIQNNQDRIKKELKTDKGSGELITFKWLNTSFEEETYVAKMIQVYHNKGYEYNDMAVFYRNNSLSRGVEDILMKSNIPYKVFGGMSFFSRKEVKDIIAYLKLILDKENIWAFKRVINEPKRGIGNITVEKLIGYIDSGNTLGEAIKCINNSKIDNFMEMIESLKRKLEKEPLLEFINIIMKETQYDKYIEDEPDRLDNINELKSVLAEANEVYEGTNFEKLAALLEYLSLRTDKEERLSDDNYVSLMTYHQAKGLEFKVVFMIALESGIFPHAFCKKEELEEDRRVAYVGITRAKEKLFLTCARSRRVYGEILAEKPSQFINEMDRRYLEMDKPVYNKPFTKAYHVEEKKPERVSSPIKLNENVSFEVGDKISHSFFGDGIVVGLEDDKVVIAFKAPHGIKKILAAHPSLTKL